MTELQLEYLSCCEYCSEHPEASRKVLMDMRRELKLNGLEIPTYKKPEPKRVPTAEELQSDEVFMLALINALHEDDELWLKYRFISEEDAIMEFYNRQVI